MSKVLLMPHALVGNDKHFVPLTFRNVQQVTVAKSVPTSLFRSIDRVAVKVSSERCRSP